MLRKILGPVFVEDQLRIKYNDELYDLYGYVTVVQRNWLAHFDELAILYTWNQAIQSVKSF